MKTKSLFLVALPFALLLGCKDKGEDTKPQENPISTFVKGTDVTSEQFNNGRWEVGIYFSASVPGKITQVGAKMPEVGTYTVTLWDAADQSVLRQKAVEVDAPEKLVLIPIDPLEITDATKKYVVSINNLSMGVAKKYYVHKKGTTDFMPFVQGSILFHSEGERIVPNNSTASVFPVTMKKNFVIGIPEITFVPN